MFFYDLEFQEVTYVLNFILCVLSECNEKCFIGLLNILWSTTVGPDIQGCIYDMGPNESYRIRSVQVSTIFAIKLVPPLPNSVFTRRAEPYFMSWL
jgi:hypothetical protein